MDAGDSLRVMHSTTDESEYGGKQAVVLLGLKQIQEKRALSTKKGRAFLFRSLKTPEEVFALRELYGSSFYSISVFSDVERRSKSLSNRLGTRPNKPSDVAYLISRDETDASNPHGQNVRETFPLADLFINVDQLGPAKKELARFVELIFGNTFKTPTRAEYCMFYAQGASYRSADLGRQVGSVISSSDGEILAVGTNEVPKYKGGQFWGEDELESDPRDFIKEYDWNDVRKKELIRDLLQRLCELKENNLPMNAQQIDDLITGLFSNKPDDAMKGALVMDIIGFYRSVHAETAAIIDAARRGVAIRNGIMYVTAFPCHECARHILASGINLVRYIEPYPKSLALDQYPDSIEVATSGVPGDKLIFESFVGVAPRQYMFLFAKNKRKLKDGKVVKWLSGNCKLRFGKPIAFFGKVEDNWLSNINETLRGGESH